MVVVLEAFVWRRHLGDFSACLTAVSADTSIRIGSSTSGSATGMSPSDLRPPRKCPLQMRSCCNHARHQVRSSTGTLVIRYARHVIRYARHGYGTLVTRYARHQVYAPGKYFMECGGPKFVGPCLAEQC